MPGRTCGAPQLWHLGILDREDIDDIAAAAAAVAADVDVADADAARGRKTHEKGTLVSSRTLMLPGNRHVTGWIGLPPPPPAAAVAVAAAAVVIVGSGLDVALSSTWTLAVSLFA
jgi:hypothetical protein